MALNIVHWERKPGEFARRAVLSPEILYQEHCDIIVEYGTQALFFKNGVFVEVLEPGRYPVQRGILSLGGTVSEIAVVWVDSAAVEETFGLSNVRTLDNIPLDIEVKMTLSIGEPALFCANVLKQRESYTHSHLRSYLSEEVRNGVEEFLALCPISKVSSNRSFKDVLEEKVRQHIHHTLERDGFQLLQIRAIRVYNPDIESLRDFAGGGEILRQRREEEIEQARQLLEHDRHSAAVELERDIFEVARYKKKALLNQELRAIRNQEQIMKSREDAASKRSLQDMEMRRIIGDREQDDLIQLWEEEREDRKMAREFWVQRSELEQRHSLEKLEMKHRLSLAQQKQKFKQLMEHGEQQHQLDLEREKLAETLRRKALEEVAEQQMQERRVKGDIERKRYRVAGEAEIADMVLETQKKRAEVALAIRERMALLEYQRARQHLYLKAMHDALSRQTQPGLPSGTSADGLQKHPEDRERSP